MMDANQVWDVDEAIAWIHELAQFDPWWIEEPTSPDDVLGTRDRQSPSSGRRRDRRALPPTASSSNNCSRRRPSASARSIVAASAASTKLAVILMAAKFGVPVCPHAGGVGLCEYVQHLSIFDYIAVSGTLENRVIEYVDHLHEHFVEPVVVRGGRYVAPTGSG